MNRRHVGGFALLVVLIFLTSISAVFLLRGLNAQFGSREDIRTKRDVLRGLRDAQLALIAHGLIEDNSPGTLPSPSGEGQVEGLSEPIGFAGTPEQPARRLPWKFLGLSANVAGECLWYAVSDSYRNNEPTHQRSQNKGNAVNPNNPGSLGVDLAYSGTASEHVSAAAVLIAPGLARAEQTERDHSSTCAGGSIGQFLELANAAGSGAFIDATATPDTNDVVWPITHTQLLRPVLRRVLTAVSSPQNMLGILKTGLAANHVSVADTRLATPSFDAELAKTQLSEKNTSLTASFPSCSGIQTISVDENNVPINDRNGQPEITERYTEPVSWLCFNDWYAHMKYLPSERAIEISLLPEMPYHCRLNVDSGSINCGHTTQ